MTGETLAGDFEKRYHTVPRLFYAPGRVNLIGEHTDYNDGFVMPFAIQCGTYVAASARNDRHVRVYSQNLAEGAEFDLDSAEPLQRKLWVDYVQGMARALESDGVRLSGADLLISSDVPSGAGLSSSAALEVSTGKALCEISQQAANPMVLVKAGHRTELEYVGTQSGIMDQYVAVFGRKGCCLLIDCRSLDSKAIPLPGEDVACVVTDTGVKHELSSTAYNQRRQECERGVELLQQWLPGIRALRDVSPDEFIRAGAQLPPVVHRRCRHVISENQRTLDAAEALLAQNAVRVGALMYESHRSLQQDFEVTIPELDLLVDIAQQTGGVFGSRMTGGGFGGCTITLVRAAAAGAYMDAARTAYQDAFGKVPGFMIAQADDGVREVSIS